MPASQAAPCTAIKLAPSNSCHKIDRSTAIGLALMPPSTGFPNSSHCCVCRGFELCHDWETYHWQARIGQRS
jgi:hypothetical protein